MGRWSKRPDDRPVTIEQFELEFEERVAYWHRRRLQGENIDALAVKSRKLDPREVKYLELKAEQRQLMKELEDDGW